MGCGIGNGGSWRDFRSLLTSSSCQAPSVPYELFTLKSKCGKAFCSCSGRCLQRLSLTTFGKFAFLYVVYTVVFFTGFAIIALVTRHGRMLLFYHGIEKLPISVYLGTNDKIIHQRSLVLIDTLYIGSNRHYF